MTALSVHSGSLVAAPRSAASVHIAKMFAFMAASGGGQFTKAVTAEYLDAVSDIPEWIIEKVSMEYRHGKRGDGKWIPYPGEFARACHAIRDNVAKVKAREAQDRTQAIELSKRRAALEARTPEQIQRVRELTAMVKQACARTSLKRMLEQKPAQFYRYDQHVQDWIARQILIRKLRQERAYG